MPAYAFEGLVPVVDSTTYVHPLASLIGDVILGPGCYIGPGASLRGDFGRIVVEGDTSIQDSCTVHASADRDTVIGRGATIGHGAIIHGCVIGKNTLVGMNAVVLDNAVVGDECLVAALSLVRSDMQVPDRTLVAGNPARALRTFASHEVTWKIPETGPREPERPRRMRPADRGRGRPSARDVKRHRGSTGRAGGGRATETGRGTEEGGRP